MMTFSYCEGKGCPIKWDCLRHKEEIDFKTEDGFALSPYNHQTKSCEFYEGEPKESEHETFLERIKRFKNGNNEN